jgi:hypothetical protein
VSAVGVWGRPGVNVRSPQYVYPHRRVLLPLRNGRNMESMKTTQQLKAGDNVRYTGALVDYRGIDGVITQAWKSGLCKGRFQVEFSGMVEYDPSLTCAAADLEVIVDTCCNCNGPYDHGCAHCDAECVVCGKERNDCRCEDGFDGGEGA